MIVYDDHDFAQMVMALEEAPLIVYDTETTGLRPFHGDKVIGMAFGFMGPETFESYYVPLGHAGKNFTGDLSLLKNIFEDPDKVLLCWNAKFDMHMTDGFLFHVKCKVLCAMLAFHLCNENEFNYGLKYLAGRYFGSDTVGDEAELKKLLAAKGLTKGGMADLTAEEIHGYATSDAALTYKLFSSCLPVLKADGVFDIFKEVCAYSEVLRGCERRGVLINQYHCSEEIKRAKQICMSALAEIEALAECKLNPNSSVAVPQVLKTMNSQRETLEPIAEEDTDRGRLAKLILDYRGWAKAVSSYHSVFLQAVDDDGYVHTNFNLHRVISGRLSCSGASNNKNIPPTGPNLQALSRQDENRPWTMGIRTAICAPPGSVLISSDYSQAELRLLAHYTKDDLLMKAYADRDNQGDIHQMVAELLQMDRYYAKRINFGMVYGLGVREGMVQLKRPEAEVRRILNKYNASIPGIRRLYTAMEGYAKSRRYIKMWTGRRRRFADNYGFHKAMSNLIQGGVAEILRIAMIKLHAALPEHSWMVLQVHDDILTQAPEKHALEVAAIIKHTMEDFNFDVPFIVDQKLGRSWGEMTPIDVQGVQRFRARLPLR